MSTVRDLAASVRSKNAGPFSITIDLFFDEAAFRRVVHAGRLDRPSVARALQLDPSVISVFAFAPASAIKISFPRDIVAGSPGDRDSYGGQQFAALLDLECD
jgi:hypothetical protein